MFNIANVKSHSLLSGYAKREEARNVAKMLRQRTKGTAITVKQDVKDKNGWGVQLIHNDGKGTLTRRK